MSAKKHKGTVRKGKDKKDNFPSRAEETSAGTGHPDYIFPLVLTSATQELFGCRGDVDVSVDKPHKLLRKDDIIVDMRNRAAVSDFSVIKQAVLDYPDEEMLLVFDRDFTYGQSFYLVLTVEAKENMLRPPADVEGEEDGGDEMSETPVQKTPEPTPWSSLGSEREIEEESVMDTRPRLMYKFSRVRREFGAPPRFSDYHSGDVVSCPSYHDKSFSLCRMERETSVQAVPNTKSSSTQTLWFCYRKHPRNMCTQYEPRELEEEEKELALQSDDLRRFLSSVTARFDLAIQQNEIMNVFVDDWRNLGDDDSMFGGKVDTHLKEYQSFTHTHYRTNNTITYVCWHPTVSGVIAVAVSESLSFEERINDSTLLLLHPALILFWSFSDPINPQLMLECPHDVFCFEFCPSDPNVIAGGCMNGQVVLWDISAHVDKLQGGRGGGIDKHTSNTNVLSFEDRRVRAPPVGYSAVSAVESGHRAPITDIQWLPENFQVSRTGIPLENKTLVSVQIVTCAPDCCVMFWDLRAPRMGLNALTDTKQKSEQKSVENHGVSSTFKHLDLTWKPLFRVTLPKLDTSGEYSPLKFSLRACKGNGPAEKSVATGDRPEPPDYSQLRVPSAKHQQPLEDISTKIYTSTEDGEIVYTDWKLEKDNESGRLFSPKPTYCFKVHDCQVNTLLLSPFFEDIILTVGGWNFAIWKEDVMAGPIVRSACSQKKCTAGSWSLTRPGLVYIGKEDGTLEVWDLLEKTHEPSQSQNVSTTCITCIKPWTVSLRQQLLAVSDHQGTLHILQVPWLLRHPAANEKLNVSRFFEKEVERLVFFEKRRETQAREKKDMEAAEQRRKTEAGVAVKQVEELVEEAQKEYEDYVTLDRVILKDMGLTTHTQDISDP
ncbi:dynein axonemal intermediate chain 3 isoform X2 [Brachyhypopomus gauderio]|uniref:dynein axonemal intermediate chain 3 isoform X2 n=1 Tax=Brachyhypopomus gauderio TaxID=698409 RepID=UPI004042280F